MNVILVDPQLGVHGLGAIQPLLSGAHTWPAATIQTAIGQAQADAVLHDIEAAGGPPGTIIGRAAGCDVAAKLFADKHARHVLLIDPLGSSTRDPEFNMAGREDHGTIDLAEMVKNAAQNPDPVWEDPLIAEGRLPDRAYETLARGASRDPAVRIRLAAALRAAEEPRQPYDDRRRAPSTAVTAKLDWLSNLKDTPRDGATIWLSHDSKGRAPTHRHKYLEEVLPHVTIISQSWEEYDFLTAPETLAAAIRAWLEDLH